MPFGAAPGTSVRTSAGFEPKNAGVLDVALPPTTSKRSEMWCPSSRHPHAVLSPGVPKTVTRYIS